MTMESGEPDWKIDLGESRRESQTDQRIPLIAEIVRGAEDQLRAILAMMSSVEDSLRDCAANGMSPHDLADQCSLSGAAVDRVLAGGTLFDFPR